MSLSTSVLTYEPTAKIASSSDSTLSDDLMEGTTCEAAFADVFEETVEGVANAPGEITAQDIVSNGVLAKAPAAGSPISLRLAISRVCELAAGNVSEEAKPDEAEDTVAAATPAEDNSEDAVDAGDVGESRDRRMSDSHPCDGSLMTDPVPFICVADSETAAADPAGSPISSESTKAVSAANSTSQEIRSITPILYSQGAQPPARAGLAAGAERFTAQSVETTGQPLQAGGAGIDTRFEPQAERHFRTTSPIGLGSVRPGSSPAVGRSEVAGTIPSSTSSDGAVAKVVSDLVEGAGGGETYALNGGRLRESISSRPGDKITGRNPPSAIVGSESMGRLTPQPIRNEVDGGETPSNLAWGAGDRQPDIAGDSLLPEGNALKSGDELLGKNPPVAIVGNSSLAVGIRSSTTAAEKYADRVPQFQGLQKTNASTGTGIDKKNILDSDDKPLMEHKVQVGTETANPVTPMLPDSRHPRFAALQGESMASGVGHSIHPGASLGSAPEAVASNSKAAVAAVEAIRQITDAADVLWATERSGVNLRLKLDDVGVAVSVAYRDGEIRATFHADSPELRNALSAAWEKHVFSVSEQKPYRFAEPVFSSSHTSSNSDQGSFAQGNLMGGDSSRQPSQQAERGNPEVIRRSRRGVAAAGAPVAASQVSQSTGNSSRLHAFA